MIDSEIRPLMVLIHRNMRKVDMGRLSHRSSLFARICLTSVLLQFSLSDAANFIPSTASCDGNTPMVYASLGQCVDAERRFCRQGQAILLRYTLMLVVWDVS